MVYIVSGHERKSHQSLFQQLFQLRHDVFIKNRGWTLPSRNGQEIDQYDTPEAVYFIEMDSKGEILSHVRATPTMRSSLLADYFPHLVENGQNPRSPNIYETTRFMVLPVQHDKRNLKAKKAKLLAAVTEWCMDHDITHLQTVIDAGTLASFVEVSLLTTPMGLPHPFGGGKGVHGGGECIAFRVPAGKQLLEDIKSYGGFEDRTGGFYEQMPLKVA